MAASSWPVEDVARGGLACCGEEGRAWRGSAVEARPDWFVILICGGLATLLGLSVLLCAMIFDEYCDAAARVLALRGGGDHEE